MRIFYSMLHNPLKHSTMSSAWDIETTREKRYCWVVVNRVCVECILLKIVAKFNFLWTQIINASRLQHRLFENAKRKLYYFQYANNISLHTIRIEMDAERNKFKSSTVFSLAGNYLFLILLQQQQTKANMLIILYTHKAVFSIIILRSVYIQPY